MIDPASRYRDVPIFSYLTSDGRTVRYLARRYPAPVAGQAAPAPASGGPAQIAPAFGAPPRGTPAPAGPARGVPAPGGSVPSGSDAASVDYLVRAGDRPDLLAMRTFADPLAFWRLADANLLLDPWDLVAVPGRVIRLPSPAGTFQVTG
jgi:hypothetical protein